MKQGRGAAASTHGDVVKGAETTTHAIQEVATIGGAGDVARIVTGSVTLAVDLEKGVARSYSAVPDLAGDKQVVDVDKIFEKVINPYLTGVLQHPQSIEMREGMLHIHDVEGSKKTGSMEMRLEAMEQQVFKCQGMVERGLNANHMMITVFTNKHRIDANDIGKHLSRLYDRIDQLQAKIYDLENQNCEYEYRFKTIRLAANFRIPVTRSSFHDGAPMPWKM
ncbi:40S ribosomal protein S5-1 [Hordeum vulgare]|nr:40S ribosomal protein S5-1 [Hordeum vulgare]